MNMLTRCQQPHQHHVGVVNNHADTASAQSTTTRTTVFCKLSRISMRKRKMLQNRFCLVIWGPDGVFWSKQTIVENLVTLSLYESKHFWSKKKEAKRILFSSREHKVQKCSLTYMYWAFFWNRQYCWFSLAHLHSTPFLRDNARKF